MIRKHANSLKPPGIKCTLHVLATSHAWWRLHLSGPPPLFLSQSFHCTSSSNSLSTCCPGLAQAAASAWLCSWLAPSHSSGLNSNRVSDKYERALPVILYHSSLLIFFGELPTLCRYFTIYCIFCLFVLFFSGRLFKEDREHVYLSPWLMASIWFLLNRWICIFKINSG